MNLQKMQKSEEKTVNPDYSQEFKKFQVYIALLVQNLDTNEI